MPLSEKDLQDFIAGIPELTAHRYHADHSRVVRSTKNDVAARITQAFNNAGLVVVVSDCGIGM